jgi:xylulokinase
MLGTSPGGFLGLSLSSTRGDMARAVMEGIAFELRWVLDEIREAGMAVDEMRMVGGAAKSAVWPRIVADAAGTPVVLPDVREAASRGAAILAGVGAGAFPDPAAGGQAWRGHETGLPPDPTAQREYDDAFGQYREVWEKVVSAQMQN